MKERPLPSRDTALLIHIEHSHAIELSDFTTTLDSIANLYASFVKKNGGSDDMAKSRLYVEKIKEGSIDIVLCERIAACLIPFMENVNTILEFASYIKKIVEYFCHSKGEKPELTVDKCNDIDGMFAINANDAKGKTSISAININNPSFSFTNCTFNFHDSNSAQNQIRQERTALMEEAPEKQKFERQLMVIYQVRGDKSKDKGNKAVIESISTKKLALLFDSDELKQSILFSDENPMKKGYFVDGEIFYSNDKAAAYKITALHDIIDL